MKEIIKYEAYDGRQFLNKSECILYEINCRVSDHIISKLQPTPIDNGCSFANGHGYIQHDKEVFLKVRRELLEQANNESPHKWITQSLEDETVHSSWAGRWIDECCTGCLNKAWHRIMCTDSQFREWGQPYYADNPDRAPKQIELNAPCNASR